MFLILRSSSWRIVAYTYITDRLNILKLRISKISYRTRTRALLLLFKGSHPVSQQKFRAEHQCQARPEKKSCNYSGIMRFRRAAVADHFSEIPILESGSRRPTSYQWVQDSSQIDLD